MRAAFLDTSVLVLATGAPHRYRSECRALLRGVHEHGFEVHVSVEAIQEFFHHRLRKADASALEQAERWRTLAVLHSFDEAVLTEALRLIATGAIRGRDAVHAATARLAGFQEIVSLDSDFDRVEGLARLTPEQWLKQV